MKREYEILITETMTGIIRIQADSEGKANEILNDMADNESYLEMMDNVTHERSSKVIGYKNIDGDETETAYIPEMDMTIIVQYTYRNGEPVAEQIIGFYHGKPNEKDTEYYTGKGTVALML